VVNSFLSGYAAATGPVAADAVTTDEVGLETGEIRVTSDGFPLPAYWARPRNEPGRPLVLVAQEIFGLHAYIKDVCRRLAKGGYAAVAPELYARQGSVAGMSDMQEIIDTVVRRVPDKQVLADLDAVVEHTEREGLGDTGRLGITGFCWGGRIVWLYSAHQARLKAGVAWYGKLAAGPYSTPVMQPQQPLDVAGELHGAILGLYGGKDDGIPLTDVARMRAELARAGKSNCEIAVYPDAGHAFHADYRPSYHEASAKDGWERMLAWFRRHGLATW
jgi:carboxymethylenebutenolidase